jgi:hypothetical protein
MRAYKQATRVQASTGTQANFEQRLKPEGRWQSNAHLDIINE